MATAPRKPPITTHVLDTARGRPAPDVPVTLTLLPPSASALASASPPTFTATTDKDGRVGAWTPVATTPFTTAASLEEVFDSAAAQKWELVFDTGGYFARLGARTCFPEVVVRFVVAAGEEGHWHVPVLVSGGGWGTYRGS